MATQRSWQAEQRDWLLGLGLRAVLTSAGEHRWTRRKWDGHPQQLLYAWIPKDENREQAFNTGGWFSPGRDRGLDVSSLCSCPGQDSTFWKLREHAPPLSSCGMLVSGLPVPHLLTCLGSLCSLCGGRSLAVVLVGNVTPQS